jgi:hypothetical protein
MESRVLKRKPEEDKETICQDKKRQLLRNEVRNMGTGEGSEKDILIVDTGGGRNAKVTSKAWKAWKVLHRTSHRTGQHIVATNALGH